MATGAGTVTKVLLVELFLFGAAFVAVMVDMTDTALRIATPASITENLSATTWGGVTEESLSRCASKPEDIETLATWPDRSSRKQTRKVKTMYMHTE